MCVCSVCVVCVWYVCIVCAWYMCVVCVSCVYGVGSMYAVCVWCVLYVYNIITYTALEIASCIAVAKYFPAQFLDFLPQSNMFPIYIGAHTSSK